MTKLKKRAPKEGAQTGGENMKVVSSHNSNSKTGEAFSEAINSANDS
jgi:hypothetical protein